MLSCVPPVDYNPIIWFLLIYGILNAIIIKECLLCKWITNTDDENDLNDENDCTCGLVWEKTWVNT